MSIFKREKKFKKDAKDIKRLVPDMGYCLASDMITVDGKKVGYMYREQGDRPDDSGWRFFAGQEGRLYCNNPKHFEIYSVNTIANYDSDIIKYLDAPIGSAFERDSEADGRFIEIESDSSAN